MTDSRIEQYQKAVSAMMEGQFGMPVPIGPDDDVGKLGKSLAALGGFLETRFRQFEALSKVAGEINEGLLFSDVLDHVYEGFRGIFPYDRIGCALLEDDNRMLRALWARTEAPRKFA